MGVITFNLNVVVCSSEEPSGIPWADSEFGEGQGKAPSLKNKSSKFLLCSGEREFFFSLTLFGFFVDREFSQAQDPQSS